MRTKKLLTVSGMALLLPLLNACEEAPDVFNEPNPGAALIYAYPADGMVDLPTGSKMVLTFSTSINAAALSADCDLVGDNYVGPICLADSEGQLVDLSAAVLTNRGRTLTFSMKNLREGEEYRLWMTNDIARRVVNLGQEGPVVTFRTRQYATLPNAAPEVLAINMEKPEVYLPDSGVEGRFPFMDFAPVRLTFTEPLVQTSVQYGSTVSLVHLLRDEQGELTGESELVEVNMLSERQYITLDPRTDLIGGETYQVTLSGIQDFDETPVADVTYEFVPLLSKASVEDENPEIRQLMKADPTLGEAGYPSISRLHGEPLNQFNLETVALGTTRVDTKPVTLEGWLGRPSQFPDATPVVARAGQQLRITGIDPIKLGGEVDTKISSGDIIGTFVTDVTGFLTKNPYRPDGVNPDDDLAPLHVYMDFDLAMHAENANGNGSINQNLMHIRAVGVVDVKDGALTFEVFRTLELDLFSGATTVSADFALGVRADVDFPFDESNTDPLIVTGALPVDGEPAADPADNIIVTFNEPVDVSTLPGVTLTNLTAGVDVPIQVRSTGSAVVVTPLGGMARGADFQLNLGSSIADMGLYEPSPLMLSPDDATFGDGIINFTTSSYEATAMPDAAPLLIGMYPGIGCALVDTELEEGKAGRCDGGISAEDAAADDNYEPDYLYSDFLYDVSRPIEMTFNQPMDLETLAPGTISVDGSQCDTGAICMGALVNSSWETIPLSLVKNPLRARAYPEPNRVTVGEQYRIVINGGNDAAGVFRSDLGYALNTDPLNGIGNPD
ncbi:Ig-like domain-containing protein [Alcanivorax sp. S6407]|nr:Ig-like domain-containing protein [Alcanivorax sp. S6407]